MIVHLTLFFILLVVTITGIPLGVFKESIELVPSLDPTKAVYFIFYFGVLSVYIASIKGFVEDLPKLRRIIRKRHGREI